MGSDGLQMDVVGPMDKGVTQNKEKRHTNARSGHILECMVTAKKHSKLAGMVVVTKKTKDERQNTQDINRDTGMTYIQPKHK